MMNVAIDVSEDAGTLVVNGIINIQCAAALKDELIKLQVSGKNILLNLEGLTGADISFLQLLCSAHRSSIKLNKCLNVTGSIPPWLKQAVRNAGYDADVCSADTGGSCLWAKVGGAV